MKKKILKMKLTLNLLKLKKILPLLRTTIEFEIELDVPEQINNPLFIAMLPVPNNEPEVKDNIPDTETAAGKFVERPPEFNCVPDPIVNEFKKVGEPFVIVNILVPLKLTVFVNVIDTLVVKKPNLIN
jgi:hypothetical protein